MARVGLVLGAGGPVGHAYHVGTLAALADAGWDARQASVIVGTSIGAVTGALLRAGISPADLYAQVVSGPLSPEGARRLPRFDQWPDLAPVHQHRPRPPEAGLQPARRPEAGLRPARPGSWSLLGELVRRPWRARASLVLAALGPTGLASTAPIATVINGLMADRPADGQQPALCVCAVDLDNGRRAVFGPGRRPSPDLGTAVAASSAVPAFFEPVVINGRRYVDGGLHSPVNADVVTAAVTRFALDVVIVSVPMGIGEWPGRFGVDIPGRISNHRIAGRELAPVRQLGCPVTRFEPGRTELAVMHYNAFDRRREADIATAAFATAAARASMAAGREPALAAALGPSAPSNPGPRILEAGDQR